MADEKPFDPVEGISTLRDNLMKAVDAGVRSVTNSNYPALDIYRQDNMVVVQTTPLAGLDASTISVSMEGDTLTIGGVTRPTVDIDPSAYLKRELNYGQFERAVIIPVPVKAESAKAKVRSGTLTISLPVRQPDDSEVIDVQVTD